MLCYASLYLMHGCGATHGSIGCFPCICVHATQTHQQQQRQIPNHAGSSTAGCGSGAGRTDSGGRSNSARPTAAFHVSLDAWVCRSLQEQAGAMSHVLREWCCARARPRPSVGVRPWPLGLCAGFPLASLPAACSPPAPASASTPALCPGPDQAPTLLASNDRLASPAPCRSSPRRMADGWHDRKKARRLTSSATHHDGWQGSVPTCQELPPVSDLKGLTTDDVRAAMGSWQRCRAGFVGVSVVHAVAWEEKARKASRCVPPAQGNPPGYPHMNLAAALTWPLVVSGGLVDGG